MKQATFLFVAAVLALVGCKKAQQDTGGPAVIPPTQVVAVEARIEPVTETLSLVGTLAANEMVELKSEIEGVIQTINFDEGLHVEKGQLLIQLDDTKLAAGLAESEADFKLSKANYDRSVQLFKDKTISQQEFDQVSARFEQQKATIELKRRQLRDTRIVAPFAGVTGPRNISAGQVIDKNSTSLGWLVDLNPVKAEVNVPERFLGQLQIGQNIEVKIAAFPGRTFKGTVYFIAPQVDPATRTALVKARLPNPDLVLRPGMFANLDLALQIREKAVVIPEAAVMFSADRASIFVVDGESNAQIRPVNVGVRLAGIVEITKGLQGGEKVIVEGLQKVRPGGKVKAIAPDETSPYAPKPPATATATTAN